MSSIKTLLFAVCAVVLIVFSCQDPGDSYDNTPEPTATDKNTPSPEVTPENTASPEVTPTPSSGPTPPVVTGVQASCLEYTDHINVNWAQAEGAESYRVYRYLHKSPDSLDAVFDHETNEFDDTDATGNTPYFYRVASVIGTEISDLSTNYVKGIYSTIVDIFEPNDDKPLAGEVTGTAENAVIYSFSKGEAQDTDWYAYTGAYTLLKIKVILPGGSPFDGELTLQIENGTSRTLVVGENELDFSGSNLYFSIEFTVPDLEIDDTGTYTVYLELIA